MTSLTSSEPPIYRTLRAQPEAAEVESLNVELPQLPEGESPNEPGDWMFDSDRDFIGQTEEFQRRQKKR